MADEVFESYAQNGEDIILWRALRDVVNGRYVDVGANDPVHFSITKAFYDRGWRGISVEPSPQFAALHREQRPGDIVAEVAVTSKSDGPLILHEIGDTGLSTLVNSVGERHASKGWAVRDIEVATKTLDAILAEAQWDDLDIHFITIDVEGAELDVLESINLKRWRPWVLVVESTAPLSTEQTHESWEPIVIEAGYEFCLFDGLSRYYVAAERADQLKANLSYSASVFDSYTTAERRDHDRELVALRAHVDELRADASDRADALQRAYNRAAQLDSEIEALHRTRSWRITAPLRLLHRTKPQIQPGVES